jgi:hypothetical protein
MGATCTIYYRDRSEQPVAGHVTSANSVFEAARIALNWWAGWGGEQPADNTILEIRTVGNYEKCYYVRVGRVRSGNRASKPANSQD